MPFSHRPFRRLSPVRVGAPVYAVGWRAYVACPGDSRARVALTDDVGTNALGSLPHGSEVEILAWRPRGAGGTLYRVRATRDGLEGWLAVGNLRSAQTIVSSALTGSTPSATRSTSLRPGVSRNSKGRFGQRSE